MTLKYSLILSFAFLFSISITTVAQSNSQSIPPAAENKSADEQHASGSIEEEMRAKRAIRYAEDAHKENLERAREVCELASALKDSFRTRNKIDRDDNKRLDRLEKLAKQLRSKAGGSESDDPLEKPPPDLKTAIARVADTAESLGKLVEKTPRQVVSAAVIDEANVLLQLIDLVRQFSKQ